MHRVVGDPLAAPAAAVLRHAPAPGGDADRVDGPDGGDRPVGELRRHGVVVGVEADQRQRVGRGLLDPRRLEPLGRQGQHRRSLLGQQLGLGRRLAPQPSGEVGAAVGREPGVEPLQAAVQGRDGHQEVAAGVAHERLDVPLLVRPAHQAEVGLEEVVADEAEEGAGEPPLAAAGDLRDGDLEVVGADPPGHAAEEGEGPDVSLAERLGALAWEGAAEDRVGVGPRHDEHRHLGGPAVEDDRGRAEVDLGLAGRVGQRDEHLGSLAPPGADGVLDDGQPALVAVLVAEPTVDPHGGVPLLPRGLRVVLEDLVDDRQQRTEHGGPPSSGGRKAGGSVWVRIFLRVL